MSKRKSKTARMLGDLLKQSYEPELCSQCRAPDDWAEQHKHLEDRCSQLESQVEILRETLVDAMRAGR
jgi:hypothetical protein